ncbi:MAG: hypothetical protein MI685_03585, partial [Chlorobiales bacterium]|nr:hypothetical protein [Chlorobiales bacterium]
MAFSTDSDLETILPAVFNHGISSFDEYHPLAEADVVRDIRKFWIPRQHTVALADFDMTKLQHPDWKHANCFRALGWYILPRLATETDVSGFTDMLEYYQAEYEKEMTAVIDNGVMYDTGSGHVRIQTIPVAE